ncbi:11095_t:CDS:1, partial [Gigaspora rosea]
MQSPNFNWLYNAFDDLVIAISNYANYLLDKREVTALNHESEVPIRSIKKAMSANIYEKNVWIDA